MNKETHERQIMEYIEKHGSITSLEAIHELGCTRLSARIWDLEHKGTYFKREIVTVPTRGGGSARVMRYSLAEAEVYG